MLDIYCLNLAKCFFILITFAMCLLSFFMNICENKLPIIIRKTFRYGKISSSEQLNIIKLFEFPKSTFRHFYANAIIIFIFTYTIMISTYIYDNNVPEWFLDFLDYTCGCNRTAKVSVRHTFLAMSLLGVQIFQRFISTFFISIFAKHAKIYLTHYLIGMAFYPVLIIIIVGNSPKFTMEYVMFNNNLTIIDGVATLLFLYACYHQYKCSIILSSLRKNTKGEIIHENYKIPYGDWFEYLSSPHCFAEILMYSALTIILYGNNDWIFVYLWVLVNQTESILLNHWWYLNKFKQFPKNRKLLIPFVY